MFSLEYTTKYRRDRKRCIRRGQDMAKLDKTIELLQSGVPMPPEYRDHDLKGKFIGLRECHVGGLGDWLLIYKKYNDTLILLLTETGTHSDLFE